MTRGTIGRAVLASGPLVALAALLFLGVGPFVAAIYISLTKYDLSSADSLATFVGSGNYERAAHDPLLAHAAGVALIFALIAVSVEIVIGTACALAFADRIARHPWRYALCLLPAFIAPVIVALTWKLVLQSEFGVVSYLLRSLGLYRDSSILSETSSAFAALVVIDVWQWTPFIFALLTAAVATQPRRPVEAAILDGATRLRIAIDVTLPHLGPLVVILGGVRFVDALREFEKVYILTGGGPGAATEMLSMYTWRVAFREWNFGYASALSVIGYIIAMCATTILISTYRRGARYA